MGDCSATCVTDATTPTWGAKLILFSITILALLPSSGVLDAWPMGYKLAALLCGGLSAIGYQAHKAQLKQAHIAGVKLGAVRSSS